jgi:SAM-dependent methyltransferase
MHDAAVPPGAGTQPIAALLTPPGSDLLAELRGTEVSPATALELGSQLRLRYPPELVASALAQQELRLRAQAKFSRAADMFFTRDGLEQASAEPVARHRASRFPPGSVVADLCCGIGGDLLALAAAAASVLAVDRDPVHLAMARANAGAYGVADRVRPLQADVRSAPLDGADAVFIDPARRHQGRRLRPGDSEPPLPWCLELTGQVPAVAIKAAPGLPLDAVPEGWETEFIATGRDLKEAVLWSPALATARSRATVLPGGEQLVPLPPGAMGPVKVRPPGEYLLDPSPAVTRAGLVEDLAWLTGSWQIDGQIAFLCSDEPVRTPFGRCLRVLDSGPWNQKLLPSRLRAVAAGSVDIRRRGLAGNVEVLHRQLARQLDPAATRRITLVMTRMAGRPWALLCTHPDPDPGPGPGPGPGPDPGPSPDPAS